MRQDWRPLALVSQLGLTVAASLIITLLFGLWLDSRLGTGPLFTLVFVLVGIGAATVGAYRLVAQAIAESVASRPATYRPKARLRGPVADEDTRQDEAEGRPGDPGDGESPSARPSQEDQEGG